MGNGPADDGPNHGRIVSHKWFFARLAQRDGLAVGFQGLLLVSFCKLRNPKVEAGREIVRVKVDGCQGRLSANLYPSAIALDESVRIHIESIISHQIRSEEHTSELQSPMYL